jgi:hypothetical protein
MAVYSENHIKTTNSFGWKSAELLNFKVCGTYNYHWALKGLHQ